MASDAVADDSVAPKSTPSSSHQVERAPSSPPPIPAATPPPPPPADLFDEDADADLGFDFELEPEPEPRAESSASPAVDLPASPAADPSVSSAADLHQGEVIAPPSPPPPPPADLFGEGDDFELDLEGPPVDGVSASPPRTLSPADARPALPATDLLYDAVIAPPSPPPPPPPPPPADLFDEDADADFGLDLDLEPEPGVDLPASPVAELPASPAADPSASPAVVDLFAEPEKDEVIAPPSPVTSSPAPPPIGRTMTANPYKTVNPWATTPATSAPVRPVVSRNPYTVAPLAPASPPPPPPLPRAATANPWGSAPPVAFRSQAPTPPSFMATLPLPTPTVAPPPPPPTAARPPPPSGPPRAPPRMASKISSIVSAPPPPRPAPTPPPRAPSVPLPPPPTPPPRAPSMPIASLRVPQSSLSSSSSSSSSSVSPRAPVVSFGFGGKLLVVYPGLGMPIGGLARGEEGDASTVRVMDVAEVVSPACAPLLPSLLLPLTACRPLTFSFLLRSGLHLDRDVPRSAFPRPILSEGGGRRQSQEERRPQLHPSTSGRDGARARLAEVAGRFRRSPLPRRGGQGGPPASRRSHGRERGATHWEVSLLLVSARRFEAPDLTLTVWLGRS